MKKAVLWGKEIKKDFTSASESQVDAFLDLVQFIQQNDIWNAICESTLDEAELWGWLYSKEQIELNDIKRELARRMERAKCVSQEEFDELLGEIGKIQKIKILVLSFERVCVYYISTILEYYTGIRSYLALEKKDDFCDDLQECFPNIYFVEGIRTTMNTLNRSFEDIREEIVEHLTQLNDYRVKFGKLLDEHKSFQEVAQQFSAGGCKKSCVYGEIIFSDRNQICRNLLSNIAAFMLSNFFSDNSIATPLLPIHVF